MYGNVYQGITWIVPFAEQVNYPLSKNSDFGPRDQFATSNGQYSTTNHRGLDLNPKNCHNGDYDILATRAGKVTSVGGNATQGAGYYVYIDHGDGYKSHYFHLKQNSTVVKVGDEVTQGQKIAIRGTTGSSTGKHLHFGITKSGDIPSGLKTISYDGSVYVDPEMILFGATNGKGSSSNEVSLDSTPAVVEEVPDPHDGVDFTGLKYSSEKRPHFCLQSDSTCYTSTTKLDTIKGIVVHTTSTFDNSVKTFIQPADSAGDKNDMLTLIGTNSSKNDWNHCASSECFHAVIGKLADGTVSTVQALPWNYRAWGCGSGTAGTCNDGWIQILICEDSLHDEDYFRSVYSELCNLVAYLCRLFKLDPRGSATCANISTDVLLTHHDAYKDKLASSAQDTANWFSKFSESTTSLKNNVAHILSGDSVTNIPVNSLVKIKEKAKAVSRNGADVQNWMRTKKWVVEESDPDEIYCLLGACEDPAAPRLDMYFLKSDLEITTATEETQTVSPAINDDSDAAKIWTALYADIKNEYGVAGLMGNLYHESGLRSNNMENKYGTHYCNSCKKFWAPTKQEKKCPHCASSCAQYCEDADTAYTRMVDSGEYTKFDSDFIGYGIAQWTYWSDKRQTGRKKNLRLYIDEISKGLTTKKSISDLDAQVAFLLKELKESYTSCYNVLKSATNVQEASDKILTDFENPANQSNDVKTQRANKGQEYLEDYRHTCTHQNTQGIATTKLVDAVPASCTTNGYTGDTVCTQCNKVLQYGKVLTKTSHNLDWRGICNTCGFIDDSYVFEELVSRNDLYAIRKVLKSMLDRNS